MKKYSDVTVKYSLQKKKKQAEKRQRKTLDQMRNKLVNKANNDFETYVVPILP